MGRGDIGNRWKGHFAKAFVDRCVCLDLGTIHPEKALKEFPGIKGWLILGDASKQTLRRVEFWMNRSRFLLKGDFGRIGFPENHEFTVIFHRVQWFILCPKCGRRCRKLYSLGGGVFWEGRGFPIECRGCHRLQYRSQTWPAEKDRRQIL